MRVTGVGLLGGGAGVAGEAAAWAVAAVSEAAVAGRAVAECRAAAGLREAGDETPAPPFRTFGPSPFSRGQPAPHCRRHRGQRVAPSRRNPVRGGIRIAGQHGPAARAGPDPGRGGVYAPACLGHGSQQRRADLPVCRPSHRDRGRSRPERTRQRRAVARRMPADGRAPACRRTGAGGPAGHRGGFGPAAAHFPQIDGTPDQDELPTCPGSWTEAHLRGQPAPRDWMAPSTGPALGQNGGLPPIAGRRPTSTRSTDCAVRRPSRSTGTA